MHPVLAERSLDAGARAIAADRILVDQELVEIVRRKRLAELLVDVRRKTALDEDVGKGIGLEGRPRNGLEQMLTQRTLEARPLESRR